MGCATNAYCSYPLAVISKLTLDHAIKSLTWFSSVLVINCKTLSNSEPLIKICNDEKKHPDLPDYTDINWELYPRESISHGRSLEISL